MRKSRHAEIRAVLKTAPDGMTVNQIHSHMPLVKRGAVDRALRLMPDAYIDRWINTRGAGMWSAIWCVVNVPENCPRPVKTRRKP